MSKAKNLLEKLDSFTECYDKNGKPLKVGSKVNTDDGQGEITKIEGMNVIVNGKSYNEKTVTKVE